ncbi:hypothetical protein TPAU25S_04185 [Tsukamurella paurometabola]|uniref:DUF1990 domain-containing protein n=1 Tax=Tsukamurella paurometabola (strain ATCC 8368 / DSM 20162 / CCUG 35730 / CIP 100753 / JCM 10117 / KCTC 9821 / NBRC 16120 / NCIMB 702349 / NCTC 13040) TaxID=521096 RepID=D5UYK8_TSUPD|nr:DUF1990 family protein [Tsukamurella paurometabola]ADG80311.1 Domain of unknown function DUF1990 [Tsukamurella paurometabola DSM 20162]SUP39215.1 Uncharacterized protein conserved in bacteria [Tsukamurella paurometabola]
MTRPAEPVWVGAPSGYRRSEVSARVGTGDEVWTRATHDVLRWGVKTASGFAVSTDEPVAPGQPVTVTARIAGITVTEPVEVVDVVDARDRVGFSYRTLPGHPVCGEEAFVVHRDGDDVVLTVRSLTRPAPRGFWRTAYPALRIAQLIARRRYLRALR